MNRDVELVNMVGEYLVTNANLNYVDLQDMVDTIQATSYRYSRMKKQVFSALVRKAYHIYCEKNNMLHSESDPPDFPTPSSIAADNLSDSDCEIQETPPVTLSNVMKNQMSSLYQTPKQADSKATRLHFKPAFEVPPALRNPTSGTAQLGERAQVITSTTRMPSDKSDEDDLEIIEEVTTKSRNGIRNSSSLPYTPDTSTFTKTQVPVVVQMLQPIIKSVNRSDSPSQSAKLNEFDETESMDTLDLTDEEANGSIQKKVTEVNIIVDQESNEKRGQKRKTTEEDLDDEIKSKANSTAKGKRPTPGVRSYDEGIGVLAGSKKKIKQIAVVNESTVNFSDFGGNDKVIEEICKLLMHLKHPEVYRDLGVVPPRGFLLQGPPGCGKTLLANAIAGELHMPLLKMAATELISGISGESESNIRDLFEQAVGLAPCIIFIDEIDAITPKRETAQREMERRIVSQMLACIDELSTKEKGDQVLLIGATNRIETIDLALRRAGRFDREISLGIPDVKAREQILRVLFRNLRLSPDFEFPVLAKLTPGYVGADLQALMREAAVQFVDKILTGQKENTSAPEVEVEKDFLKWIRETAPLTGTRLENLYLQMEDFEKALKYVQPSSKREGFATVPDTTWDDIGALKEIREELQVSILGPVKHSSAFQSLGLNSPAGVLLCGPPGCGKTLLAKAVANEAGINFISVKGPELLNMYVGESERAVRQCFLRAKNSAPCVIFFDELDALCPRRSDGIESGSTSRVVNQLLTEMDGMESRAGVFVMAATNRPDIIDPAILRPGRLDKVIVVNLPTSADRFDILQAITKKGTVPKFAEDVSLEEIANSEKLDGFTGADLAAIVREASIAAFRELVLEAGKKNEPICPDKDLKVFQRHFEIAMMRTKPSVSKKDQEKYTKMQEKY